MTNLRDIAVSELLPHDPPMVMLDRVLSFSESELVAEVDIRADSVMCMADGVPGWVGIEYMAQAVAAHAGYQARLDGAAPMIGYLLGTRSYKSSVSVFPIGKTLSVRIELLFVEMGLGAFACRIEMDSPVATATINVYQPLDGSMKNVDSGRLS
jgi:predicted hotdog family 3-hydroxylacyl-ACP dehydratase